MASLGDVHAAGWLWADVARLALSAGAGRLEHRGILASALRGALVVDAVDRDVITVNADELLYDTDAPGDVLVQGMLSDFQAHPGRSLAGFLQRGQPHLATFVAEMTRSGVWTRQGVTPHRTHAYYSDSAALHYYDLRHELTSAIAGGHSPTDHRTAALAALASVLHLYVNSERGLVPPPDALIAACGPLAWTVRHVTGHLIDAQATDIAAGRADSITNSSQLWGGN